MLTEHRVKGWIDELFRALNSAEDVWYGDMYRGDGEKDIDDILSPVAKVVSEMHKYMYDNKQPKRKE